MTGGGGVGGNLSMAWPNYVKSDMTVHFKNAIDSTYFMHCSSRFVSRRYDIVLYDLGANMWGSNSADKLATLIKRMSHMTGASISALINWPRRLNMHDIKQTERAARISHSFVIDVPHTLDLYAESIHPNAKGHLEIAKKVAQFISMHNHSVSPDKAVAFKYEPDKDEHCFADAHRIPIIANNSWHIVDDGVTSHKFGWASEVQGGWMRIRIPKARTCGSIITLSYLRTRTSGDIRVECSSDCICARIRDYHQKQVYPFPIVRTRVNDNVKVTETSSFYQLRKSDKECDVTVIHTNKNRVRIDGLYVRQATVSDAHNANRSHSQPDQVLFGRNSLFRSCSR